MRPVYPCLEGKMTWSCGEVSVSGNRCDEGFMRWALIATPRRGVGRDASAGGRTDRASRAADAPSHSGKRSNASGGTSASAESQRRRCVLGEPGYVFFAGRKIPPERPRVRTREGQEVELESYSQLQQDGKLQRAVRERMIFKEGWESLLK
jgi:hypothetical protein